MRWPFDPVVSFDLLDHACQPRAVCENLLVIAIAQIERPEFSVALAPGHYRMDIVERDMPSRAAETLRCGFANTGEIERVGESRIGGLYDRAPLLLEVLDFKS